MGGSSDINVCAIVKNVGLKVVVDCVQLGCDLEWAATHFITHKSHKRWLRSAAKLAKIRQASLKLKQLLCDGEVREQLIGARLLLSDSCQGLDEIADACLPKIEAGSVANTFNAQLTDELGLGRRSSFEWLVGERLPSVFEKHFSQPAGFTRDVYADSTDSPYIRFVQSALEELRITNNGIPYSCSSIARALTEGQAGRPRKKAKPADATGNISGK